MQIEYECLKCNRKYVLDRKETDCIVLVCPNCIGMDFDGIKVKIKGGE